MDQWNDVELFAAVRNGDKEAFSQLFLRYYDYLKHYGFQMIQDVELVEECIQELFLYIFDAHARLGNVLQVKAYLFSSLRRRILEKTKKEARQQQLHQEFKHFTDIQFSEGDIAKNYDTDLRESLADALNHLSWRQREAIYLRYYNGLNTKEIAEIMGVANQTILNTLHQALKNIRKHKRLKKLFDYTASCLLIFSQL